MAEKIVWPEGEADKISPAAVSGAIAVTIENQFTIIETTTLTGNATLNLTIDAQIRKGALLKVLSKTNATESLTPGTGMTGPAYAGVAGKTKSQSWYYDGSTFKPDGVAFQID